MAKKRGRKGRKGEIQHDDRGPFRWETFFVRGKQRRRKVRVTIIDGEEIDDLDEWLLANADDITLHQLERWDLIMRREDEERAARDPEDPPPELPPHESNEPF